MAIPSFFSFVLLCLFFLLQAHVGRTNEILSFKMCALVSREGSIDNYSIQTLVERSKQFERGLRLWAKKDGVPVRIQTHPHAENKRLLEHAEDSTINFADDHNSELFEQGLPHENFGIENPRSVHKAKKSSKNGTKAHINDFRLLGQVIREDFDVSLTIHRLPIDFSAEMFPGILNSVNFEKYLENDVTMPLWRLDPSHLSNHLPIGLKQVIQGLSNCTVVALDQALTAHPVLDYLSQLNMTTIVIVNGVDVCGRFVSLETKKNESRNETQKDIKVAQWPTTICPFIKNRNFVQAAIASSGFYSKPRKVAVVAAQNVELRTRIIALSIGSPYPQTEYFAFPINSSVATLCEESSVWNPLPPFVRQEMQHIVERMKLLEIDAVVWLDSTTAIIPFVQEMKVALYTPQYFWVEKQRWIPDLVVQGLWRHVATIKRQTKTNSDAIFGFDHTKLTNFAIVGDSQARTRQVMENLTSEHISIILQVMKFSIQTTVWSPFGNRRDFLFISNQEFVQDYINTYKRCFPTEHAAMGASIGVILHSCLKKYVEYENVDPIKEISSVGRIDTLFGSFRFDETRRNTEQQVQFSQWRDVLLPVLPPSFAVAPFLSPTPWYCRDFDCDKVMLIESYVPHTAIAMITIFCASVLIIVIFHVFSRVSGQSQESSLKMSQLGHNPKPASTIPWPHSTVVVHRKHEQEDNGEGTGEKQSITSIVDPSTNQIASPNQSQVESEEKKYGFLNNTKRLSWFKHPKIFPRFESANPVIHRRKYLLENVAWIGAMLTVFNSLMVVQKGGSLTTSQCFKNDLGQAIGVTMTFGALAARCRQIQQALSFSSRSQLTPTNRITDRKLLFYVIILMFVQVPLISTFYTHIELKKVMSDEIPIPSTDFQKQELEDMLRFSPSLFMHPTNASLWTPELQTNYSWHVAAMQQAKVSVQRFFYACTHNSKMGSILYNSIAIVYGMMLLVCLYVAVTLKKTARAFYHQRDGQSQASSKKQSRESSRQEKIDPLAPNAVPVNRPSDVFAYANSAQHDETQTSITIGQTQAYSGLCVHKSTDTKEVSHDSQMHLCDSCARANRDFSHAYPLPPSSGFNGIEMHSALESDADQASAQSAIQDYKSRFGMTSTALKKYQDRFDSRYLQTEGYYGIVARKRSPLVGACTSPELQAEEKEISVVEDIEEDDQTGQSEKTNKSIYSNPEVFPQIENNAYLFSKQEQIGSAEQKFRIDSRDDKSNLSAPISLCKSLESMYLPSVEKNTMLDSLPEKQNLEESCLEVKDNTENVKLHSIPEAAHFSCHSMSNYCIQCRRMINSCSLQESPLQATQANIVKSIENPFESSQPVVSLCHLRSNAREHSVKSTLQRCVPFAHALTIGVVVPIIIKSIWFLLGDSDLTINYIMSTMVNTGTILCMILVLQWGSGSGPLAQICKCSSVIALNMDISSIDFVHSNSDRRYSRASIDPYYNGINPISVDDNRPFKKIRAWIKTEFAPPRAIDFNMDYDDNNEDIHNSIAPTPTRKTFQWNQKEKLSNMVKEWKKTQKQDVSSPKTRYGNNFCASDPTSGFTG